MTSIPTYFCGDYFYLEMKETYRLTQDPHGLCLDCTIQRRLAGNKDCRAADGDNLLHVCGLPAPFLNVEL